MKSRTARRRERQRRKHKQWFHLYEVEYFIRDEYPRCPEFAVVRFAHQVCTEPKNWRGVSIAVAVDHVIQNMLRHELTDYDQLLLVGVKRKEARARVKPKISAMIRQWRTSTPSDLERIT
ncbi:DUF2293 domain-containing protein [uncultured Agrobacterium sp.]|uniref:DUF2293 domain-containing protein n=1 Tax=uncultured Agrobacterium sp. TaxID=157277 RepID=UPI0025EB95F1|nr:DUF2293 domain-containing protein [uncultured Agrobacterium sp.]